MVSNSEQYLIDDRLSVGRVEICSEGRYGTICDDVWTNQAASVVCRELGFSSYGTYIFAIECATVRIFTIDLDSVYTYFECIVF